MAQLKSPRRDQILHEHIKKLVDSRPSNRSSIYLTLTQVAITAVQKGEGHEIIHLQALPVTFKDIMSGNESQTLDALGFLGGLLQFLKLNIETQISTVELLSQKLKTVTSKGQSRKLMWSLANIQFDEQLPRESLCLMLNAALLYLGEKPPIHSLSTMCEALNTLKNMGQRRCKFVEENLPELLSVVFPCLFNEADRIRQLALECLEPFTETIQREKLLNASYQTKLKNTYYSSLMKLVSIEAPDSLRIWGFLIAAFGTEMQSVSLLNGLLKIEETALKSKNTEFRQMALEHWKFIIDCFALTPSILNNSKRIHLILVPLKSTESRTEEFSVTKIHLWWHLLNQLGNNAVHRYQEVTSLLLNFCFGSDGSTKGNVHTYSNTSALSASILASVLSPRPKFTVGSLTRSFPFLDAETFGKTVGDFIHYSCVASSFLKSEHREIVEIIFQSFVERCNVEREYFDQLKTFIDSIFKIALEKIGFVECLLASLTNLISKNTTLYEAVMANIMIFFQWAGKNEPLPTHPFYSFLRAFFNAGMNFDLSRFSATLAGVFEAIHTDEFDVIVLAELWKQFASSILSVESSLPWGDMEEKILIIPITWIEKLQDEDFHNKWRQLFAHLRTAKPGFQKSVMNCFSMDSNIVADDRLLRFLIRALSRDVSQHMSDIEAWFNKWIASWSAHASEDAPDYVDYLPNLILFINEFPSDSAEPLLLEFKLLLQAKQSQGKIAELLKTIFDSSGPSKSKAVQKLRTNRKICKMFSGTPTQPRSTSRSRVQNKTMDDFVVIPPTPKSKRILTERQKEVMRSKKLNSSLPAMYSDLSQDSQLTENSSQELISQETVSSIVSNVAVEEEALLEPPSPMSTSTITAITELSVPLRQRADNFIGMSGNCKISSIEELLKKDLKLQSKVTVNVIKLLPSTLLDKVVPLSPPADVISSSLLTSPKKMPSILSDRPAPASVKAARLKLKSLTAVDSNLQGSGAVTSNGPLKPVALNENSSKVNRTATPSANVPLDKENSEAQSVGNSSEKITPSTLVRRVTPVPVKDNSSSTHSVIPEASGTQDQSEKPSTSEDVDGVEEMEVDIQSSKAENSPATISKTDCAVSHQPEINSSQGGTNPTICITCEEDETSSVTISDPMPSVQTEKPPEGELVNPPQNPSTGSVQTVSNSLDLFAESSQPQESAQKNVSSTNIILQPKKFLKDHCTKAKSTLLTKNRGNSPNTGKRGAQILELSRKISSEPPSKKAKVSSLSPNGKQGKRAIGDDCSASPPDKSPAREKEPWVRHTYSPYASPSGGILKKRPHADESDSVENSPTSLTKSRRVSFAFPEVSDSVDIPKVRSTRTRRSLLGTYKHGHIELDTQASATSGQGQTNTRVTKSVAEPSEPQTSSVSADAELIISSGSTEEKMLISSNESCVPEVIDTKLALFVTSALTSDFTEAPAVGDVVKIDESQSSPDVTSADLADAKPVVGEESISLEREDSTRPISKESTDESQQDSEMVPNPSSQTNEASEEEPTSSLESQSSPSEELDSQIPIFMDLIECSDAVSIIIDQLVSISWRAGMYELLGKQNIHTIGELCRLSAAEVQRLPLDPSRTIRALTNYKNEKDAQSPTVADLSDHTYSEGAKSESSSKEGNEENPASKSVDSPTVEQKSADTKDESPNEVVLASCPDVQPNSANINSVESDKSEKEFPEGNITELPSTDDSNMNEPMDITLHPSNLELPNEFTESKLQSEEKSLEGFKHRYSEMSICVSTVNGLGCTAETNERGENIGDTDFDNHFHSLSVDQILALINRHPERNAIYLSCNRQILLRAFPSLTDEK